GSRVVGATGVGRALSIIHRERAVFTPENWREVVPIKCLKKKLPPPSDGATIGPSSSRLVPRQGLSGKPVRGVLSLEACVMCSYDPRVRRPAFTLIELLVVIAIIAI